MLTMQQPGDSVVVCKFPGKERIQLHFGEVCLLIRSAVLEIGETFYLKDEIRDALYCRTVFK